MSKFNKLSTGTLTSNKEGAKAYSLNPKLELALLLITSFADNQFYRSNKETVDRIRELIHHTGGVYAAKAAIWTRTEWHMRSISHIVAGLLVEEISMSNIPNWGRNFFEKIVIRPDDMTEILAYSKSLGLKNPTNAMKRGFAAAFSKFDEYQLAKYQNSGKDVTLRNIAQLCHPEGTESNTEALKSLASGTLRNKRTWEAGLSKAGQDADTVQKAKNKREVWRERILSGDLSYMALIRNLRNILRDAPELTDKVSRLIVEESRIRKSRMLPFRFATALEQISLIPGSESRQLIKALSIAVDISCNNIPEFEGRTLVAIDTSMSMEYRKVSSTAALFTAVLAKSSNADIINFSKGAIYENYNPSDSVLTIAKSLKFQGGGTNFQSIFLKANRAYDRIFLISDMQAWMIDPKLVGDGLVSSLPRVAFKIYKEKFECTPKLYSIDLCGYGSGQFPEPDIFCLGGFSDKLFSVMHGLEENPNNIVEEINSIEI